MESNFRGNKINDLNDYDSRYEQQIEYFEFKYYVKCVKSQSYREKTPFSISRRSSILKLSAAKNMYNHENQETIVKPEKKKNALLNQRPRIPDCDRELNLNDEDNEDLSSALEENVKDFYAFRRYFYTKNRTAILSSFQNEPNYKISNIRLAPVDTLVQERFMQVLQRNQKITPVLVYHGACLNNLSNILKHGLSLPYRQDHLSVNTPAIDSNNGEVYDQGIYCSFAPRLSFEYVHDTNTLLACAVLPKVNKKGNKNKSNRKNLVVTDVSIIVPLFLIDVECADSKIQTRKSFQVKRRNSQ